MDAQRYLKQWDKLDKMIRNKDMEAEQWRIIARGLPWQAEGDRVKASGSKQKMADAVHRYTDIEREIAELEKKMKEITDTIEQLPAERYDILHKSYIQGMSFKVIAVNKKKSYAWVTKNHKKALQEVEEILERRNDECEL